MSSKQRRIVDLSHPIRHGMITYPGLPGPEIGDHLTREASREIYAPGTEFAIGRISMVSNTGTYVDSPFHRFDDGHDLAALPLDRLIDLDGVVVRVQDSRPQPGRGPGDAAAVRRDRPGGADPHRLGPALGHRARTATATPTSPPTPSPGWSSRVPCSSAWTPSTSTTPTTAPAPPTPACSPPASPSWNICAGLERLPPEGFRFHAAPPAVEGMGTFPVRAYALARRRGEHGRG